MTQRVFDMLSRNVEHLLKIPPREPPCEILHFPCSMFWRFIGHYYVIQRYREMQGEGRRENGNVRLVINTFEKGVAGMGIRPPSCKFPMDDVSLRIELANFWNSNVKPREAYCIWCDGE